MNALDKLTTPAISLYKTQKEDHSYELCQDSEIWTAFKAGDQLAFEFMFKNNYELLLNYGLRFNQNEDDIKDYIQQLFSKLWESRTRLGANTSIKSYLIASLRRMILRGRQTKYSFLTIQNLVPSFQLNLSVENRFFTDQAQQERMDLVSKLIEKLPRRQKEAIFLKYYGDHKFGEIAEIMGISTRVVYKLIYKAMDNLSSQVSNNGNLI